LAIDLESDLDLVLVIDPALGIDRASYPPIGPTALVTDTTGAMPSGVTLRICQPTAAVFGEIILITPGGA
jgi:hypothetical protein